MSVEQRAERRRQRRRRQRGFTLIEAVVAITILSVAMVALLQSFATGLHSLSTAEAYTLAAMQARSKLAELGTLVPFEEASGSGEFENGSTWSVEVESFEPEGPIGRRLDQKLMAHRIEVTVSWRGGRSITLKTLRVAPKP